MAPVTPVPVVEPPKGEHIFPRTQLTAVCLRWKELTAEAKRLQAEASAILNDPRATEMEKDEARGLQEDAQARHSEAFGLMERIIIDSTPMYERLAQHEGYDSTVELSVLVQAARQKTPHWVMACDVQKLHEGKLFSWMSTSVAGDTEVMLSDGSYRTVATIVAHQEPVEVVTWDQSSGYFTVATVNGWHRNPATPGIWRYFEWLGGSVVITGDHELVCSDLTWRAVDSLTRDSRGREDSVMLRWERDGSLISCGSWQSLKIADTSVGNDRYDISVPGTENFIVRGGLIVHNCAKNVFRSEVAKQRQHTTRYHATSDNLEKFAGFEDHVVDRHDLSAEIHRRVQTISVRWGDPQELQAIRFMVDCFLEAMLEQGEKQPNKPAILNGARWAFGLSEEMTKFFYQWAVFALRDVMYHRRRVPFTLQDLLRLKESYTFLPDFIDIVGWDRTQELIMKLGGQRIKFPTTAQLERLHQDYLLREELDATDHTPEGMEAAALKRGRSPRAAKEIFEEMSEQLNANRLGEHPLCNDDV